MKVPITLILFAGFIATGFSQDVQNQEAEVTAPIGRIRGSFAESRLGRRFFSARGIRYGEPPIGENRFRQAIPAIPFDVFDATKEGPSCPQPGGVLQSEDCLRLNVYTPELPSPGKPDVGKPVLVFFHPGGFYAFSAQSISFGPEYLMDTDIVLVTVNYRLMSLGFMSTGDSQAPGNLGLKDQVEALRWIQRNIAAFGGDPNCVTISGYSAGAWSVSLHLVSPMSKGLFHRAIAMSGSATTPENLGGHQRHLAVKQAEILDCPTDTTENMIACLRTKPFEEFANSLGKFFEWYGLPILIWSPVVEPVVPGVERFLTAEPTELIRQGKAEKVPVMTGITKDEFAGVTVFWVEMSRNGNNSHFEDVDANWEEIAPIIFQYQRGTPRSKEISRALRTFYFKDQPVSLATVQGLANLFRDSIIGFPVHRFAKLMSEVSPQPVYYYEVTYQGRYSHRVWNDTQKPYGVVHHDDLLYLFYLKSNFPYFKVDDPEYQTVKRMTTMWTNFAKTGNPIPANNQDFENVTWEPLTPSNKKYLEIGDNLTMKTGLYAKENEEWDRLFPVAPARNTKTSVKH
ncbi:esterase E4 [Athalia rosae]|uniref:esterase E4 n=1 Tax=Athalia rosae TaxID=37344 RepID=UPI0020338F71|nr:esterase E4 [Athalia rosae]